MSGEGQNGERFNRQVKATEAYANLSRDVKDLHDDLMDPSRGILPRIEARLDDLHANPMVRLGMAFKTTRRAFGAVVAFAGTCVAIGAGVRSLLGS